MTTLHHEIRIDAPPQTVWKILADLEAVQYYNPLVARARYVSSNRAGVGAMRHCDFKPKGGATERVTGCEDGKQLAMEIVESDWPMKYVRWNTRLAASGVGTLVTQDTEYQVKFGLAGRLLDALVMRRKFNSILHDIFVGLKRHAENGAATR